MAGLAGQQTLLAVLAGPAAVLAAATAGYTAFLFGQCEGRDLWQSPLLLPTLLAQAVIAGTATYSLLDLTLDVPEIDTLRSVFMGGLAALGLLLATELWSKGTRHVELAVAEMTRGRYALQFWLGGIVIGLIFPGALVMTAVFAAVSDDAGVGLAAGAAVAALIGLFAYEDAYVRAGQSVPLS